MDPFVHNVFYCSEKYGTHTAEVTTGCLVGILCVLMEFFHAILSSADFFSSKFTFSKHTFRNTIRVSNGLDLDKDRRFVMI